MGEEDEDYEDHEDWGREIGLPPIAEEDPEAVEVLRMWARPGEAQQVALRPTWSDPGAWGLALVDIARHVANAYEREGRDREEVLQRIRMFFDAEWDNPTEEPEDITDRVFGEE